MPAKRSPRKSRTEVQVSVADLATSTATPTTPVTLADDAGPSGAARPTPVPPPSRSGIRGGSTAARGQSRRYAFRRS
ncbi:hypothetical protein [Micromonospora halophytica]|uniref:Uncharacterized protein n=1 Tax=Micromonospora halophytica TaxID=47864 RepID=A0A1C5IZL7_9ACTN|nr:hypothetical protein [Micromonospora halophytica]SCG63797.1 hypothetical protein GA0070560_11932 [Micromonospora halophytica]